MLHANTMRQRLQIMFPNLINRQPAWGFGLVAFVAAVNAALAYAIDTTTPQLMLAVVFGLMAMLGFALPTSRATGFAVAVALAASVAVPAVGSNYTPAAWTLTTALAAIAVAVGRVGFGMRYAATHALILTVGLLLHLVLEISTAMLPGIILFIIGQSAVFLLMTGSPDQAATPVEAEAEDLVRQLSVTTDELGRAVQAINDVAAQQSDGASEQATMIEDIGDLLDEFLTLSNEIQVQARSVAELAAQATSASQNGQAAIDAVITGMESIREQVSAIANSILTLAELTQQIDSTIGSVSEIATQSNLLALNASIEAARAGAQGRGFAVVADEVRSLAGQSTEAAAQVRSLLRSVQKAITTSTQATQSGIQQVDAGRQMTNKANEQMSLLTNEITASFEATSAIYDVIRQQVDGLEQITINVERLDRIAQQSVDGSKVVRTVSTNLTRLADELQRTLDARE